MASQTQLDSFLKAKAFGVAGASVDRAKYGNKVLRTYQQRGLEVVPIHPKEATIEGLATVPNVDGLPSGIEALSIVTPPAITEQVVQAAARRGIKHVWMQPGAESPAAIAAAQAAGMNVIADGTCLLVVLGFQER
jgi:predicted CoA-binding protein